LWIRKKISNCFAWCFLWIGINGVGEKSVICGSVGLPVGSSPTGTDAIYYEANGIRSNVFREKLRNIYFYCSFIKIF
jgi:hypothetical protein